MNNKVKSVRGRSAYAIFLCENYKTVLASLQGRAAILTGRPQRIVIQMVATQWNELSNQDKEKWKQREQEERSLRLSGAPLDRRLKKLWLLKEAASETASGVAGGGTSRGVASGAAVMADDGAASPGTADDGAAAVTVFGDFEVATKFVGEGSYGIVCEVVHRRLRYRAAAKLFKDRESYSLEVQVYQALLSMPSAQGNACFLQVLCCSGDDTPVKWIVLPLCPGTLSARLRATDKLTSAAKTAAVQQLHTGLNYLHACKWLHGDVKPSNVLWSDFSMKASIVDFGCAKPLVNHGVHFRGVDFYTPNYRAPELWNKKTYGPTQASEAWAFGCCLAEVWTGRTLFCPVKGYGGEMNAASGPGPIIRDYVMVQTERHNTGNRRSAQTTLARSSWERSWECLLRALPDSLRGRATGYLHPEPALRRKLNRVDLFVVA